MYLIDRGGQKKALDPEARRFWANVTTPLRALLARCDSAPNVRLTSFWSVPYGGHGPVWPFGRARCVSSRNSGI